MAQRVSSPVLLQNQMNQAANPLFAHQFRGPLQYQSPFAAWNGAARYFASKKKDPAHTLDHSYHFQKKNSANEFLHKQKTASLNQRPGEEIDLANPPVVQHIKKNNKLLKIFVAGIICGLLQHYYGHAENFYEYRFIANKNGEDEEFAEELTGAIDSKLESLPIAIWNATWGVEEIEKLFTLAKGYYPVAPESNPVSDLALDINSLNAAVLRLYSEDLAVSLDFAGDVHQRWRPLEIEPYVWSGVEPELSYHSIARLRLVRDPRCAALNRGRGRREPAAPGRAGGLLPRRDQLRRADDEALGRRPEHPRAQRGWS